MRRIEMRFAEWFAELLAAGQRERTIAAIKDSHSRNEAASKATAAAIERLEDTIREAHGLEPVDRTPWKPPPHKPVDEANDGDANEANDGDADEATALRPFIRLRLSLAAFDAFEAQAAKRGSTAREALATVASTVAGKFAADLRPWEAETGHAELTKANVTIDGIDFAIWGRSTPPSDRCDFEITVNTRAEDDRAAETGDYPTDERWVTVERALQERPPAVGGPIFRLRLSLAVAKLIKVMAAECNKPVEEVFDALAKVISRDVLRPLPPWDTEHPRAKRRNRADAKLGHVRVVMVGYNTPSARWKYHVTVVTGAEFDELNYRTGIFRTVEGWVTQERLLSSDKV